ncbi:hypothetical protein [Sphingomonas sp.]|uniref:hypothetical protein n=1 Tax=Sphingomonas sp. TaxID=28214 RepID=UPI003B3A613C
MSKNSVTDWDQTPANNTDIAGINIAEFCPPSSLNDAIRTIMAQIAAWIVAATGPLLKSGGAMTGAITGMGTTSSVKDSAGNARSIGFRSLPVSRSVTAAATLTLADQDSCVVSTTGGFLIPANATLNLPVGFMAAFYVDSASSRSITAEAGVTLRLEGASSTGTRTVAQRSRAYFWQVKTNEWLVSGMGVS